MAEPVTDQQLDAWLADNQPPPPWARSRPYLRQILQEQRDARAANGATQAEAAEASELPTVRAEIALLRGENQAMRRRIKALESLVAFKPGADKQGGLWEAITAAFGEYSKSVNENLKRIDERIDAVRDQQLKFGDIFQPGKAYQPSTLVVSKGSLWLSLTSTTDPPGSSMSWQLVTKAGTIVDRPRPA